MKQAIYTIGKFSIGFSTDRIKELYPEKGLFFQDMINSHPDIDEKELRKVLERVWKEANPRSEKTLEEV